FGSILTAVAFFGLHAAALCAVFFEFTWTGLILAVSLYLIRGFGLTAGFHRYFAHRAYKTSRFFQFGLPWFGAMALQRGAIGWSGLFWGFFFGTVCLYHATFLVNSICHLIGKRRFQTKDYSRNNWFVAIVAMGEGWHNNHHHYPTAARQGFYWWEFDLSYCIL